MEKHEFYMKRAIELANKGWGKTNPNPLVGSVIVKNNQIIAEGYHEALGLAHAEATALRSCKSDVSGATIYVNLEPCSHYGRTPPCAKAIIESGIKKVVLSMIDPNPKVAGNGVKMLREAGIEVVTGVLEKEARKQNEIFLKYISQSLPFVILKTAMTIDGKIASTTGDSKWITSEASRSYVHHIRDRVSGIMVGIGTVISDDPSLTTRLKEKKGSDPVRIVIDSSGKIPIESKVINSASEAYTVVATTSAMSVEKEKCLLEKNVKVLRLDGNNGRVDLSKLMHELYLLNIDSVLLEGGGSLNASALKAGIVDKVMFFIAPKIIGGCDAKTPVEGEGIPFMEQSLQLKDISVSRFDDDILIEGYIKAIDK